MGISVVIPTFQDLEAACRTVDRLSLQLRPGDEVLVVDNGPRDRHDELHKALPPHPARQLLHCPTRGSYAARNLGAMHACGEILAFTDAGCMVGPGWVEAIRQHFEQGGAPRLTGPVLMTYPGAQPSVCALVDERMHLHQHRYVREGWAATANVAMLRTSFDAVGGFDPRLSSGGDLEFGVRCAAAGIAIGWGAGMSIEHEARSTLVALLAKRRRVMEGVHVLELRSEFRAHREVAEQLNRLGPQPPRRPPPVVGVLASIAVHCLHRAVRVHDSHYRRWLRMTGRGTVRDAAPGPSAPPERHVNP
jgi:glycosyltransferase involved in cell wall biosynthesis